MGIIVVIIMGMVELDILMRLLIGLGMCRKANLMKSKDKNKDKEALLQYIVHQIQAQ